MLILEIDERSLAGIYKYLPARHLCITNIQKDQVQRNGEPDYVYQKIKKVIEENYNHIVLYLNNEEPRTKSYDSLGAKTVYYGMERNDMSFTKEDFYDVTMPCEKCNSKIEIEYCNIENVGKFHCVNCDYKSEVSIKYAAANIDVDKKEFECDGYKYKTQYIIPFYIYNYILTLAIATELGITKQQIFSAFETFINPQDRKYVLKYKDKNINYFIIKQENPETMQSILDMISRDTKEKAVFLGLHVVENSIHYANTFYFFDCNFTQVANSNVEKYIVFTETVCYDTANRMVYSGVPKDKIIVLNTFDMDIIIKEIENTKTDNIYILTNWYSQDIIKNYIENKNK